MNYTERLLEQWRQEIFELAEKLEQEEEENERDDLLDQRSSEDDEHSVA